MPFQMISGPSIPNARDDTKRIPSYPRADQHKPALCLVAGV